MNWMGILMGAASFLVIGLFHPIVIKAEYYWTKSCWPLFLAAGIALTVVSFLLKDNLLSTLTGIVAFSCFWSIKELFEQEARVKKGWFPANPNRKQH